MGGLSARLRRLEIASGVGPGQSSQEWIRQLSDEELLDRIVDELVRAGVSPEEARSFAKSEMPWVGERGAVAQNRDQPAADTVAAERAEEAAAAAIAEPAPAAPSRPASATFVPPPPIPRALQ